MKPCNSSETRVMFHPFLTALAPILMLGNHVKNIRDGIPDQSIKKSAAMHQENSDKIYGKPVNQPKYLY